MINGYDIAYAIGGLVAAPVWVWSGKARRKVARALTERVPPRQGGGPAVMIHAVSMGEINATRALVKQLRDARPDLHVIVTTTTETGWDRGKQLYGAESGVTLARYPLDITPAVQGLLDKLRPSVVVLMELEVWPNFTLQCQRRGIPVMVINGRLTQRSAKRYGLAGPVTRRMFARLAAVAAQEKAYAEQFESLGVPPDRVSVTGTMKFDTADVGETVPGAAELAASVGIKPGEPVLVCGSTGPGEEVAVLESYRELVKEFPALRLAIVPRHPERFDEVAGLIAARGYAVLRRSRPTDAPGAVIIGDTMGELRKFYALATVVLVGRSLVDLGPRQRGSDMIEPAALGKPVIVGRWTQNFAEVMNAFRGADAVKEIPGPSDVTSAIKQLLQDPTAAAEMGRRARQAVVQNRGATGRHVRMILELLPKGA